MLGIPEITAIEDRYVNRHGPSLGDAYEEWRLRWESGERDRETALRLAFLTWYACSEPTRLTGLDEERVSSWPAAMHELFESLGGEARADPETLAVIAWMARQFPWCCGPGSVDASDWEALGARLAAGSSGPLPENCFSGRGVYGHYFAHVLRAR